MKPFAWEYPPFLREREKTKMKPKQTSDTSAAYVSWETQQHKTNVSISTSTLNLTYETFSMGHDHIFFDRRKIWSSDRDATPTQPTVVLERLSDTDQILVTSNKKLIKFYKAFYHPQGVDKFGNPTSRPKRRTESQQWHIHRKYLSV